MSRHHVLQLARVVPGLPTHLVKSLFVLAIHADHRTGLSRPGMATLMAADIAYSSWHRHMSQLADLGLVRQTVKGNKDAGMAAEYELLFAPALTGESASVEPIEDNSPSPERGGPLIGENASREDPPLTPHEVSAWIDLRDLVVAKLTPNEHRRLNTELASFDKLTRLRRTAVRLALTGHRNDVIDALTARRGANGDAYAGVRSIPAAMWRRVETVASIHDVSMADVTPVEVVAGPQHLDMAEVQEAAERLEEAVPGLLSAMAHLQGGSRNRLVTGAPPCAG